jgi:hypothetical protein
MPVDDGLPGLGGEDVGGNLPASHKELRRHPNDTLTTRSVEPHARGLPLLDLQPTSLVDKQTTTPAKAGPG